MCCAQLHGALVTLVSHKVAALWTLALAQLGLGRFDAADDVLCEAARDHVLICEADIPMALLGWKGLDGMWASDSTCGCALLSAFTTPALLRVRDRRSLWHAAFVIRGAGQAICR